jgi:hypothetical protein
MAKTKSGIEGPTDKPKNDASSVPVKIYPGSKNIGAGASLSRAEKNIEGPCCGKGIDGK